MATIITSWRSFSFSRFICIANNHSRAVLSVAWHFGNLISLYTSFNVHIPDVSSSLLLRRFLCLSTLKVIICTPFFHLYQCSLISLRKITFWNTLDWTNNNWIYLEYIDKTIEYTWNILIKQLNILGIYWTNNWIYLEYIEQTTEYIWNILNKQF